MAACVLAAKCGCMHQGNLAEHCGADCNMPEAMSGHMTGIMVGWPAEQMVLASCSEPAGDAKAMQLFVIAQLLLKSLHCFGRTSR